jgi:hypothetical protein
MRNNSFERQSSARWVGDDPSARTRLTARAIDCGYDSVHDGELELPRQDSQAVSSPQHERTIQ